MAFNIKFYKISDAPNVLNKDTSTVVGSTAGYTCTPFEPVGTLDGSVLVDYVAADLIETANYAYISGDNRPRYCYVRDFSKEIGNKLRVYVTEDPLMTFSAEIKMSPILATRSSVCGKDDGNVGYNAYLDDGLWKCDSTTLFYLSEDLMEDPFSYPNDEGAPYILMTAG